MDPRRFVPSTEGLEGRALLSGLFSSVKSTTATNQDLPETYVEKEHRVERLPSHMEEFRGGRFLPVDTIKQLQTDLLAVAARLHKPKPGVLDRYNTQIRNVASSNSLSIADARGLNHAFGVAVAATGATKEQVANLQKDMNALAKVDANSPQPVFLATNDYTIVLETVLGIGRAIRQPTVPQLAAHNGTRAAPKYGITPKSQPVLIGTYDAFATVQILDSQGHVYGSSVVQKNGATQANGVALDNGKYAVKFDQPLADGLYTFYVRAVDSLGHVSHLSKPFKLKVITRHIDQTATSNSQVPGGPHALNHA